MATKGSVALQQSAFGGHTTLSEQAFSQGSFPGHLGQVQAPAPPAPDGVGPVAPIIVQPTAVAAPVQQPLSSAPVAPVPQQAAAPQGGVLAPQGVQPYAGVNPYGILPYGGGQLVAVEAQYPQGFDPGALMQYGDDPFKRKRREERKRTSPVWLMFIDERGEDEVTTCRECGAVVPYKNSNPTNMRKHAEVHHREKWIQILLNSESGKGGRPRGPRGPKSIEGGEQGQQGQEGQNQHEDEEQEEEEEDDEEDEIMTTPYMPPWAVVEVKNAPLAWRPLPSLPPQKKNARKFKEEGMEEEAEEGEEGGGDGQEEERAADEALPMRPLELTAGPATYGDRREGPQREVEAGGVERDGNIHDASNKDSSGGGAGLQEAAQENTLEAFIHPPPTGAVAPAAPVALATAAAGAVPYPAVTDSEVHHVHQGAPV